MPNEPVVDLSGLRIVHVTSAHPPFDPRIFEKQCRSLAAMGADVTLVAGHDSDGTHDGVRLLAIAPERSRLARMVRGSARAIRRARTVDADVYHLHDPELLPWALVLRLTGRRVVFDMHENLLASLADKPYLHRIARPLVQLAVNVGLRLLLARVPVVFAEDSYAEEHPWISTHETVRNHPLVDQLVDARRPASPHASIAYLGAVRRERGIDVTLDALRLLHDRGVAIEFHCVGPFESDEDRARVEARVHDLGLDGVHIHGYRRFSEALGVIAHSHIGLAVLEDTPNMARSLPTKIFDYVGLGLQVIASDLPLYRALIEDLECGSVVHPQRPEELAEAIVALLAEDRDRSGERSTERLSRYDWHHSEAPRLAAFVRRVAAS